MSIGIYIPICIPINMCIHTYMYTYMGFPGVSDSKESACNAGDHSQVRKIPSRRKWLPTPVFKPGEFHGQRSLVGTLHGITKSQTQLK